jgi:hypothetical protein
MDPEDQPVNPPELALNSRFMYLPSTSACFVMAYGKVVVAVDGSRNRRSPTGARLRAMLSRAQEAGTVSEKHGFGTISESPVVANSAMGHTQLNDSQAWPLVNGGPLRTQEVAP